MNPLEYRRIWPWQAGACAAQGWRLYSEKLFIRIAVVRPLADLPHKKPELPEAAALDDLFREADLLENDPAFLLSLTCAEPRAIGIARAKLAQVQVQLDQAKRVTQSAADEFQALWARGVTRTVAAVIVAKRYGLPRKDIEELSSRPYRAAIFETDDGIRSPSPRTDAPEPGAT